MKITAKYILGHLRTTEPKRVYGSVADCPACGNDLTGWLQYDLLPEIGWGRVSGWCADWLIRPYPSMTCPHCGEPLVLADDYIDEECECCGNSWEVLAPHLFRCLPEGVARVLLEEFKMWPPEEIAV